MNYYPQGSEKNKAMQWLIVNMLHQESYDDYANEQVRAYLRQEMNHNMDSISLIVSQRKYSPQLQSDLNKVSGKYLVKNLEDSYKAWKLSPWKNEISFKTYCEFILPYKIENEPIIEWRVYLRNKYGFLIKGGWTQEEAFSNVYNYLQSNYKNSNVNYPYKQDALFLDLIGGGDCKARAIHAVYVMRSLGIAAALDFSPIWANYGENSHFWPVLVRNCEETFIANKEIDGTSEHSEYSINLCNYPYQVDSLKKVSKVYRKVFNKQTKDDEVENVPPLFKEPFVKEVTDQYSNVTSNNIIEISSFTTDVLYVCTYSHKYGWTPVGIAKRKGIKKVDVGSLIHDNIVIVARYDKDMVVPVSYPYIISHNKTPQAIRPDNEHTQQIILRRKYLLLNRWTNRWGNLIGTRIETSNDSLFEENVSVLYEFSEMPIETGFVPLCKDSLKQYLRIIPKEGKYPVFAELHLTTPKMDDIIPNSKYKIYAIGNNLTGDTLVVRSLRDNREETTFFKQFPFWIGMNVQHIKGDIRGLIYVLWNDENRIQKGHQYELFYFDKDWISLGKETAQQDLLKFNNVPSNTLLLLKDYTKGKEERIFTYKNDKQQWW